MTRDLANRFFDDAITGNNQDLDCYKSYLFKCITLERFTLDEFYRIMIDTKASKQWMARYKQYLVYKKTVTPIQILKTKARAVNIYFGIGSTLFIWSLLLNILIVIIEFYIVEANTSFLLYFEDIDKLNIYFKNLVNVLIILAKSVLVVWRFDYLFLLWNKSLQLFIVNSFNNNSYFLTNKKLYNCITVLDIYLQKIYIKC